MSATNYITTVENCYIAYYGRTGDTEGIAYWATRLDAVKGDLSEIIDAYANSSESQSLYGGLGDSAKINTIYQQVFGRDADPEGLAYYSDALTSGRMSQGSIALDILNGAQGSDLQNIETRVQSAIDSLDMSLLNVYIEQFEPTIPDDLSGSYNLVDLDFTFDGVHVGPADINYDFDGDLTINSDGSGFIYMEFEGSQWSMDDGTVTVLDDNTIMDAGGTTAEYFINDDILTLSWDGDQLSQSGQEDIPDWVILDWQYMA